MGKKRHSRDKMYLTPWEMKHEGAGKKDNEIVPVSKLPFDYCSLSL